MIFQKREYSEKAAQYFPKKYAKPFKKQFEAIIDQANINYEYFKELLLVTCSKSGISVSGDWQALVCYRGGSFIVPLGYL